MEMSQGKSLYSCLKQKRLFFKNREQEGKNRSCLGGWYQRERGWAQGKGAGGEYVGNIRYSCVKMEK
jgi:hypothetical protein